MPREREKSARGSGTTLVEFTPELKDELRHWVDLDALGADGFLVWLRAVLPAIAPPRGGGGRSRGGDPSARLAEMGRALTDCAGQLAEVNFRAAEYFRENQHLARRMLALEAMLRTRAAASRTDEGPEIDAAASAAAQRYLPRSRGSS